jgi:hypothetical protein
MNRFFWRRKRAIVFRKVEFGVVIRFVDEIVIRIHNFAKFSQRIFRIVGFARRIRLFFLLGRGVVRGRFDFIDYFAGLHSRINGRIWGRSQRNVFRFLRDSGFSRLLTWLD